MLGPRKTSLKALAALVLLIAAAPTPGNEAQGILRSVDLDLHEVVMTDGEGVEWHFAILDASDLYVNGKSCDLWELKAGDTVIVTFRLDEDGMAALILHAQRPGQCERQGALISSGRTSAAGCRPQSIGIS